MKTRTKFLTSIGIILGLSATALAISLPIVLNANNSNTSSSLSSPIKNPIESTLAFDKVDNTTPSIENNITNADNINGNNTNNNDVLVDDNIANDEITNDNDTINNDNVVSNEVTNNNNNNDIVVEDNVTNNEVTNDFNAPSIETDTSISNGVDSSVNTNDSRIRVLKLQTKDVDSEFTRYQLTLNIKDDISKYGKLVFVDTNGEELEGTISVTSGTKVYVKLTITNEDYTLLDLKVFDKANPNISLGVEKHNVKANDHYYSFVMPEEDSLFYDSGDIGLEAIFGKRQINGWVYDFASKTYAIDIAENTGPFVFDDTTNNDQKLEAVEGSLSTQYRVYMNGNDVLIKNLTIPSGCQLMFINNPTDTPTSENKTPAVYAEKYESVKINGVIGRYGSVKYSKTMGSIVNDLRDCVEDKQFSKEEIENK